MTPPADSPVQKRGPLVPGTVIDGRYRVQGLLGQWRIGVAYRVQGPHATHTLILAPLAKGRAATFRDWVRSEVERTRAVRSSALVTLQDGGLHGEQEGFLVFEPWRGHSLLEAVRLDGGFANERACRTCEQLARQAARAHASGLALGDLRPSTVLLCPEAPEVVVLDMGMARGLAEYLDATPSPATPYCSPERLLRVPPSPADDVYAIGALLYFLLTTRAPAVGRPGEARLATPPSWVKKDDGVARYIDPVVLRAMAPRGVDRYAALELADGLGALREVFQLSPAAREVLGLPQDQSAFRHEPTGPFLLHDLLGLPAVGETEGSLDGTSDSVIEISGEFEAITLPNLGDAPSPADGGSKPDPGPPSRRRG